MIPYYTDPESRLCPKARRTEEQGGVLPYTAWDVGITNPNDFSLLREPMYKIGSYGINWWVNDTDRTSGGHDPANRGRRVGQKNPNGIPVLQDCGFMLVRPEPFDPAPQRDGEFAWSYGGGMRRVCTNRPFSFGGLGFGWIMSVWA